MRILFLAPHPFFQHRGTPIADRAVLDVLSKRGDETTILTFPEGEDLAIPGCDIERVARIRGLGPVRPGFSFAKGLYDLRLLRRCDAILRRGRFDLIHAVEESALIARLMRDRHAVPYVYDMDSSFARQIAEKAPLARPLLPLLERFERAAVRGSIAVVAVCRFLEERAIAHDPTKPIRRIEDFSLIDAAAPPMEDLRAAVGGKGPVLLYAGNLEPYQGIDLLLDAVAISKEIAPDLRLAVIGGLPADIARYESKADRMGLAAHARFLGPRPMQDLGGYLRQADILVSPRIKGENTPMKIYSYLDSGRPVLATRIASHTQVLDEEIAQLADPEPAAFARGLATLLGDPDLGVMLARMAQLRVKAEYSREAYERKMLDFYALVDGLVAEWNRRRSAG